MAAEILESGSNPSDIWRCIDKRTAVVPLHLIVCLDKIWRRGGGFFLYIYLYTDVSVGVTEKVIGLCGPNGGVTQDMSRIGK